MRHGGVRGRRPRTRRDRRRVNESKNLKNDSIDVVATKKMSSTIDESLFRTLQKIYFSKIFFRKILQYLENVPRARGGAFEHFRAATSHIALFTPRFRQSYHIANDSLSH
jgi:hypothetical protein